MIRAQRSFHRLFWLVAMHLLLALLVWLAMYTGSPTPLNDIPAGSDTAVLPASDGS